MITRVPCFGRHCHRCGREVLHLFQFEVQFARFGSQFCHVLLRTTGVRRNEIGNDLLVESRFAVDAVENAFKLMEQLEGGLSHVVEHMVARMFRSHFESP